jgi:hypothetical protein
LRGPGAAGATVGGGPGDLRRRGRTFAACGGMARVLLTFQTRLATTEGKEYIVQACGEQRGHLWEGWVQFVPIDGSPPLVSGCETTQPNLTDLEYWATGLLPVYLEGAFQRALDHTLAS